MTVKTTLSFTDRHHAFLQRQVQNGIFATKSAAVAAAIERQLEAEREFEAHVAGLADVVRERLKTPVEEYIPAEDVFAELSARLDRHPNP